MRISHENILKTVGFVADLSDPDAPDYQGSGVFVSVPSPVSNNVCYLYFVTAKHIFSDFKKIFAIHVRSKEGTLIPWGFKGGDGDFTIVTHPNDDHCDIAVVPCAPYSGTDIHTVPLEYFVKREDVDVGRLGIGDEVHMVGLFTTVQSDTSQHVPIVRFGNLAMIPPKPVYIETGFTDVHLIEARSIGGLSGSPVFIRQTVAISRNPNDKDDLLNGVGLRAFFLGIAHGHWDVKESDINSPHIVHDKQRGVNLGIAIVIPAYKVLEVLNHPVLVHFREQNDKAIGEKIAPQPDKEQP